MLLLLIINEGGLIVVTIIEVKTGFWPFAFDDGEEGDATDEDESTDVAMDDELDDDDEAAAMNNELIQFKSSLSN